MTSDARAALEAGDDGFHEIQLNGKQLVFLGMATTLVSVVIFLCGVLVGRGVKPIDAVAHAGSAQPFDVPVAASVSPGTVTAPAATVATAPPPAPSASAAAGATEAGDDDGTQPTPLDEDPAEAPAVAAAAPAPAPAPAATPVPAKPIAPAVETRAEAKPVAKPVEPAKPAPKPAQAAIVPPAAVPPPAAARPATQTAASATPPASGGRIAVQVGAFKTRGEADALAKRLSTRGYAVYVMTPNDGKAVYRVRVGNFASADEAQRISARLTQQEKLKPWVTR